ncbi:MAG: hypothetical protein WC763_03970 [Candidatus Paceibacterota bacterium]|jgi:hypothetical protein
MNKKKIISIAALAVLVAAGAYGLTLIQKKATVDQSEVAKNDCAVDISAVILKEATSTLKTNDEIVTAVFNHYFDAYKLIPKCAKAGLLDHKLTSIGTTTNKNGHISADIVFELKPLSMESTAWATPETTKDGLWIKNKKGTLSIQKTDDSYFLVI